MLVLSRREKERIYLGESIVVTVVRVAGDKVRLGIEAPADMLVLRGELDVVPDSAPTREPAVLPELTSTECAVAAPAAG